MEQEIWKDIDDWAGFYQVSSLGRIKSCARVVATVYGNQSVKERILIPDIAKGYRRVTFSAGNITDRQMVHILVAKAFIPNPENKPCVNHKFGNKADNRSTQLEWATYSENERHSYDVLGKVNPQRKIVIDLQTGIFYESAALAAEAKGYKVSKLYAQLNGQNPNKSSMVYA
jgi:hypothetical protein